MSRIGKLPVSLPKGVSITVGESNLVTVKGPKGQLQQQLPGDGHRSGRQRSGREPPSDAKTTRRSTD